MVFVIAFDYRATSFEDIILVVELNVNEIWSDSHCANLNFSNHRNNHCAFTP